MNRQPIPPANVTALPPGPKSAETAVSLRRSGSMAAVATDAVGSFNAFPDSQRRESGEARRTHILFSDRYEVPLKSLPMAEVHLLTRQTFVPRGSTAPVVAIGHTIKKMTESLAARPAAQRPDTIIVAILTDCEENSSPSSPPPVGLPNLPMVLLRPGGGSERVELLVALPFRHPLNAAHGPVWHDRDAVKCSTFSTKNLGISSSPRLVWSNYHKS